MKTPAAQSRELLRRTGSAAVPPASPDALESAKAASLSYAETPVRALRENREAEGLFIWIPLGKSSATHPSLGGLSRWSFLRHGVMFGSVQVAPATCKQPGAMPKAENSTAIIRAGAKCATKTNTAGSSPSPRRCRRFATRLKPILPGPDYRATRSWPRWSGFWRPALFA